MSPVRESHYIAAYLRRHLAFIRAWDAAATVRWVQWFMRRGRAIVLFHRGKLAAAALIRLVDTKEQAGECFTDKVDGRIAYVEVTACNPGILPVFFTHFRKVFPNAVKMAWARSKYNNRAIVIPMSRAALRFV